MDVALVLLGLAALGGMTLLALRAVTQRNPPMALALLHGVLAGAGLVALVIAIAAEEDPAKPALALGLFLLAALGGLYLVTVHAKGKLIPLGPALAHGLMAIIAWLFLLFIALA